MMRSLSIVVIGWAIGALLSISCALAESTIRPSLESYMAAFRGSSFNPNWEATTAVDELAKIEPLANELGPVRDVMIALLTAVATGKKPDQSVTDALQPVRDIWAASRFVPPPSAGNDLQFIALQMLPRSVDADVLAWIDTNSAIVPPPFLWEAARRAAEIDLDRAMQYAFDANIRLRFEALRCQSPSLGDLSALWSGYAVRERTEHYQTDAIKTAYARAVRTAEGRWKEVLPDDLAEWQPCDGDGRDYSADERAQAAIKGREVLLTSLKETIAEQLGDQN